MKPIGMRKRMPSVLSLTACLLLFLISAAHSSELDVKMDIGASVNGTPIGINDTIPSGIKATFDIFYENDDTIAGYSTGFKIWSPDGATWEYYEDVFDIKFNPVTFQYDTIYEIITVAPGSRQDPHDVVLDNGGLQISYADTNQVDYDSILFGGTRFRHGIYAGPLERQILIHFRTAGLQAGEIRNICIDSTKVGPAGDFIFADVCGWTTPPLILWPEGGRCWPMAGPLDITSPCYNSTYDPAFVVCPRGDHPFRVYLKDYYGDPIQGYTSAWVEFIGCDQIEPCPSTAQQYTTIYPVAPSDANGVLTFYMDGGGCDNNCYAKIWLGECVLGVVPVKALDINKDFVVSIKNDCDFSLCNDYNANGEIDFHDHNTMLAHAGHTCEIDPCEMFGYEFKLVPEANLQPGQAISLQLKLSNNSPVACHVGLIGFFYSEYGSGTTEYLIESVPLDSTLAPGQIAVFDVPYVIPETGHGCIHCQFTTDCCDDAIKLTQCFQSNQHCVPDSNVCYEGRIVLDKYPVVDTNWVNILPPGWSFWINHVPAFPLNGPDELIFEICTPDMSALGDTASATFSACYDGDCFDRDDFQYLVVLTSQSGDVNGDCRINVGDAVFLINYIFHYGPAPTPEIAGDTNCDGSINVGDAVKLINFIFHGGLPPCYSGDKGEIYMD